MVNLSGKKVYADASVIIYATETPQLFPKLHPTLIEPLTSGDAKWAKAGLNVIDAANL